MGQITFARVDSRLIHGQVVTKWAKSSGANCIYIIDDVVNNDEFSKDIYMSSGKRYGFSVKVLGTDEALNLWNENQFGDDKVFVLFKDIATALDCLNKGLSMGKLNLGGIPKKKGREFYIKNVALSEEELNELRKISAEMGVSIFAQTVPDAPSKKI